MYLAVRLGLMLVFLALCLIGLLTLIKQAITNPPLAAPGAFIEDSSPAAAVPSEDAEGGACGEGCA